MRICSDETMTRAASGILPYLMIHCAAICLLPYQQAPSAQTGYDAVTSPATPLHPHRSASGFLTAFWSRHRQHQESLLRTCVRYYTMTPSKGLSRIDALGCHVYLLDWRERRTGVERQRRKLREAEVAKNLSSGEQTCLSIDEG